MKSRFRVVACAVVFVSFDVFILISFVLDVFHQVWRWPAWNSADQKSAVIHCVLELVSFRKKNRFCIRGAVCEVSIDS